MNHYTEKFILSLFSLAGLKPGVISHKQLRQTEFWKLVSDNAIEILTLKTIKSLKLPLNIPPWIQDTANEDIRSGLKRYKQFNRVIEDSFNAGIDICLLKGSAFGRWLWNDPCYKRMNDTDILIRVRDLPSFIRILEKNGYATFLKQQKVMGSHHIPPYIHQESGSMIGIHLHIASSLTSLSIESLWAETEPLDPDYPRLRRLSPEHNLLHLCLNLSLLKTGLRELLDIIELIRSKNPCPHKFRLLIRDFRTRERVYRCITLLEPLYSNHPFSELTQELQKSCRAFVLRDTMNRREFLMQSRSTLLTRLERNFLIFRLSDDPWDKKTAVNNFFKDLFVTSHMDRKKLRGTVMTPGWIKAFQGLTYEHGFWKVFFLFHLLIPHLLYLNLRNPDRGQNSLSCQDSFQFIMNME